MSTIILTLAGPLQSWGTTQGTETRRTGLYPTKSGVIGLIAGAQGRSRGDSVDDLRGLTMTVRVDSSGSALSDFHTARLNKEARAPQTHPTPAPHTSITNRSYRVDAVYVVFLSGDRAVIESVHEALLNPVYAPFLGRRAAVPSVPVYPANSAIHDEDVSTLLGSLPWKAPLHVRRKYSGTEVELPVVSDTTSGNPHGYILDDPERSRNFIPRAVTHSTVTVPVGSRKSTSPRVRHEGPSPFLGSNEPKLVPVPTAHDPFALITSAKE